MELTLKELEELRQQCLVATQYAAARGLRPISDFTGIMGKLLDHMILEKRANPVGLLTKEDGK